jgi:hypothetical protein
MKSWTTICRLHVVMAVLLGVLFFPACSREPAPTEPDPVAEANALGPDEVGEVCGYAYSDLVASEWATSEDGVLSRRLLSPRAPSGIDEPIILLLEWRNNAEEAILLHLGDINAPSPGLIILTVPDGSRHRWPRRVLARDTMYRHRPLPFFILGPGATFAGRFELTPEESMSQPGVYKIDLTYLVDPDVEGAVADYLAHPEQYPDIFLEEHRLSELPPEGHAPLYRLFPSPDPTKTVPPLWTGELHVGPLVVERR